MTVRLTGSIFTACITLEVNSGRNRKSLRYTLIRDRSNREKSWFLQGNACQGNSSKLQSLIAGGSVLLLVCRVDIPTNFLLKKITKSPCGVIIIQGLDGTFQTLFFKSLPCEKSINSCVFGIRSKRNFHHVGSSRLKSTDTQIWYDASAK